MKRTITTTKELLAINRRMLQGLHINFGFDFEGLYFLERIEGSFTANKVFAAYENFHPCAYQIVFLVSDRRYACHAANSLRAVKYDVEKGFDVKTKSAFAFGIDNFYSKKDFEECRKDDDTITFFIMQKKDLLKKSEDPRQFKEVTTGARYKVPEKKDTFYCSDDCGRHYFKACTVTDGNKKYNLINHGRYLTDIDYFIDKSGYYVQGYRSARSWRLLNLKEGKKRREYLAADNTKDIEALRARFDAKKRELIHAIEAATTVQEYRKIEHSFVYYRGFIDSLGDFERVEKNEKTKSLAGQDVFIRCRDALNKALDEMTF